LAVQIEEEKVKTTVRVKRELLERFQKLLLDASGKLKGMQEAALEDAIKLWVGLAEDSDLLFGFIEAEDWRGYRALTPIEVGKMVSKLREASLEVVSGFLNVGAYIPVIKAFLTLNPDLCVIHLNGEFKQIPIERVQICVDPNKTPQQADENEVAMTLAKGEIIFLWDVKGGEFPKVFFDASAILTLERNRLSYTTRGLKTSRKL
jgi:hypothetical protein